MDYGCTGWKEGAIRFKIKKIGTKQFNLYAKENNAFELIGTFNGIMRAKNNAKEILDKSKFSFK